MITAGTILFWVTGGGLFFIYLGYPLLIALLARLRPHPPGPTIPGTGKVSVLIAAYNEARVLPEKIASLLASEAAGRVVEVLVGSDGSTDDTARVVGAMTDPRVEVLVFEKRRGKPACLNDLAKRAKGEFLLFTDARQMVHPRALGTLLARLEDEAIGVVSGELEFTRGGEATQAGQGMGAYWRYEKWIRSNEGRYHSVPGATGALYCMRSALFRPLKEDTLLDDVVLPMQAVEQGYRCVFENDALVYDEASRSSGREFLRKRRTIAGCFQLLVHHPRWLAPGKTSIWWQFIAHKMLRLVSPFLLMGFGWSSFILRGGWFFDFCWYGQVLLYGLALLGYLLPRGRLVGVPCMFLTLNVTTLVALFDALRGKFTVRWR